MKEIYKDLDSYYSVSNFGNVYSKRRNVILKPHNDSKNIGYKYVTLNYNGKKITRQVHRLVAQLFIANPDNLPVVNHKDENPSNNNVNNLEWCTQSYNLSYGTKVKKEHQTKVNKNSCNAPKPVLQLDLEGNVLNRFESANEAGRCLNIANQHIIDCCNNKTCKDSKGFYYKTKTAGGFKFVWETTGVK